MEWLKVLKTLLIAFPEILVFLRELQRSADRAEKKRKVKDDIRKISEAFEKGDEALLRDVLNS